MATGDGDGRGPYQLDPFTHIVEIHFGGEVTKLDFVNGRYMVRNVGQSFDDVLGDDLSAPGITYRTGSEQRSWRVAGTGLDIRGTDSYGNHTNVRGQAYLKNKTAAPTKKEPGALNEAIRANYTMVLEFDYEDVLALLKMESPGGFDDGWDALYSIFRVIDRVSGENFEISTTEEIGFKAGTPAHDVVTTETFPPISSVQYYDTGFTSVADAQDYFFNYPKPDGTGPGGYSLGFWSREYPSNTVWAPEENFDLAGIEKGAGPGMVYSQQWMYYLPGGFPSFEAFDTTSLGFMVVQTSQPPDHVVTTHVPEVLDDYPYSITPEIAVLETHNAVNPPEAYGRIVGAAFDTPLNSTTPITDGSLPAPYGRVRVALTVSPTRLAASVNGSPVTAMAGPSLSRPYTSGTDPTTGKPYDYYKIESGVPFASMKNYEAYFDFVGIVRCMWISRKKYKDADLVKMSQIQPLPGATSPKWKKMAGFDQ